MTEVGRDTITCTEFLQEMEKKVKREESNEEVIQAFSIFDKV